MVVSGSSFYYNHRICLYSNTPLLSDPALLNQFDTLRTSKQVLLLVVLHERDLTAYGPFLSRFEKQLAGQFSALYFYTVYVNPK